tara:strand:- start:260 stop:1231 length:972 start_codon:yes stop_codon:yes gene_type:complete
MKKHFLYNGRSTLNFILNNLDLKKKREILVPDFTCDVLFQKKKNDNYLFEFYKIKKNFYFDFKEIEKKITKNTRAIVIINFFGIKQNTKKIYEICKKKDICLIIDDCHTFYKLKNSINKNCDFIFFSPSKIFPILSNGGILLEVNKRFLIKSYSFAKQKNNYFYLLKLILKRIFYKTSLKFLFKRHNYENLNAFKSQHLIKDMNLSASNINKIKKLNVNQNKTFRKKNFIFWTKLSKKLNIKPIFKYKEIKHGLPLFFPAITKNSKHSSKIFDFGWSNNIDIVSWPTLHSKQKKNKKLVNYWKQLVFFPMEKKYFLNKDLLDE